MIPFINYSFPIRDNEQVKLASQSKGSAWTPSLRLSQDRNAGAESPYRVWPRNRPARKYTHNQNPEAKDSMGGDPVLLHEVCYRV
jgi:hypothetical protein